MTTKKPAAFFCDNCKKAVPPGEEICPHCGSLFSGVRCPACGHQGTESDFARGCPACGYLADKLSQSLAGPGKPRRKAGAAKKTSGRLFSLPPWLARFSIIILIVILCLFLAELYRRVAAG